MLILQGFLILDPSAGMTLTIQWDDSKFFRLTHRDGPRLDPVETLYRMVGSLHGSFVFV